VYARFCHYSASSLHSTTLPAHFINVNLVSRGSSDATPPGSWLSFGSEQSAPMVARFHEGPSLYSSSVVHSALKRTSNNSLPSYSYILLCMLYPSRMRRRNGCMLRNNLFPLGKRRPQHSPASRDTFQLSGYKVQSFELQLENRLTSAFSFHHRMFAMAVEV
jgi:hypothetical protein